MAITAYWKSYKEEEDRENFTNKHGLDQTTGVTPSSPQLDHEIYQLHIYIIEYFLLNEKMDEWKAWNLIFEVKIFEHSVTLQNLCKML